jgi:GGDEF domain-containing protein
MIALVPEAQREMLEQAAQNTCERVLLFTDPAQLADSLEIPAAAILPAPDVEAIRAAAAAGTPVIAWGEADAWPVRVDAVKAGAQVYLPGALDLEVALDQARWIAWQRAEAPVAAVVGEAEGLAAALGAQGIRVIPATEPVDTWSPDAAVVAGSNPTRLLRALRAHPGWARTAVLALAPGPVPGADEVLSTDATNDAIIARLRGWLDRVRSVLVDRDPMTGLPNRPAALRDIDRWLGWGRRTSTPLSVGLLALDGLSDLRAGSASLAVEAAVHRAVAAALMRTIRRLDVIGRIGPSLYILGLPSCRADEARKRLSQGIDQINHALAADPRLVTVSPLLGVADSAHTADRLLARAWEDLALARQGG